MLNPNAKPFSMLNPNAKEFIPFQDSFHAVHAELLAERAAERAIDAQIKRIPKISNYLGLEQVAQIIYHTQTGKDIYELLRNDNHIFLDFPRASWIFPDITLRQLVHSHFDDDFILQDEPALDMLASEATPVVVHLHPIDHGENDWHRWKQIP